MRVAALFVVGGVLALFSAASFGDEALQSSTSTDVSVSAADPPVCKSSPFDGAQWGQADYFVTKPMDDATSEAAGAESLGGKVTKQFEDWRALSAPDESPVPMVVKFGNSGDQQKIRSASMSIGRFSALYREASGATCIWVCTATQIGAGAFLTNHHCAFPAEAVGKILKAEVRLGYLDRLANVETRQDLLETPRPHVDKSPETFRYRDQELRNQGVAFVLPIDPVAYGPPPLDYAIFKLQQIVGEEDRRPKYQTDWGLLTTEVLPPPVVLAKVRPRGPQGIAVIGHPLGTQLHADTCSISLYRAGVALLTEAALQDPSLRYGCVTYPGNSGSPVLEMRDGQMIGLHHSEDPSFIVNFLGGKGSASFIGSVLERLEPDLRREIESDSLGGLCRLGGAPSASEVQDAEITLQANAEEFFESFPESVPVSGGAARVLGLEIRVGPSGVPVLSVENKAAIAQFIDALAAPERARVAVISNVVDDPRFCWSQAEDKSYLVQALSRAELRQRAVSRHLRRLRINSVLESSIGNIAQDPRFYAAVADHAPKRQDSTFLVILPEQSTGGGI